jgi:hypothetical protein
VGELCECLAWRGRRLVLAAMSENQGYDDPPLPEQTTDDTDLGWSEPEEVDDDERLLREKPPHW